MTPRVLTTTPANRATDAALVIALHDITALPVVEAGVPVGLFTEQDVMRVYPTAEQREVTVGAIMRPCGLLATPDTSVPDLAGAMGRSGQTTVPVVRDGALVGIVSRRDLTRPNRAEVSID